MIYEDCCTNDSLDTSSVRSQCKYDFYIPSLKSPNYKHLSTDEFNAKLLARFDQFIVSIGSESTKRPVGFGKWSHFLSLTYPSIDAALPHLNELRVGIDAYELRVDLLSDHTDISIHRQIALLRDYSPLPIVYTVRTIDQLGKFPLTPSQSIVKLLTQGLRASVEYLDVEACLPSEDIDDITCTTIDDYKHHTKLLGSLHLTTPQSQDGIIDMLTQCNLNGKADILKVVTGADNDEDCKLVHHVCANNIYNKPYIGLSLGLSGTLSRVMNRYLTPVTHALMTAAAPGQLSVKELMSARVKLGLVTPKQYYLFGTPIKQSMSPSMHNAAYQTLALPHRYDLLESDNVETYKDVINRSDFGGASVTIPHKETIIPYLDEVVGPAELIGAVNTIVIQDVQDSVGTGLVSRKLGYNTDWIGMVRPIERLLNRNHQGKTGQSKGIGVVIGAGGTAKAAAYAVRHLGDTHVTDK